MFATVIAASMVGMAVVLLPTAAVPPVALRVRVTTALLAPNVVMLTMEKARPGFAMVSVAVPPELRVPVQTMSKVEEREAGMVFYLQSGGGVKGTE